MIEEIVSAGAQVVNGMWAFVLGVAPHQFGLMLVPLAVLGLISLWAARKPLAR